MPVQQLTAACNLSSRGPDALFRPPWALHPSMCIAPHIYTYIWIIKKQIKVSFKKNFFFYIGQREPNQKIKGFKQKHITLNFDERILRLISLCIPLQSIHFDFVTQETQSIWSRCSSLWALHIFSTERKQWSSRGHEEPEASCHIGPQRHQPSVGKHLENMEVDLHRSHWTG